MESINIDTLRNKLDNNNQKQKHTLTRITSSWKRVNDDDDDNESEETDDHSPSLNNIQVIFNIPYEIPSGSIRNQTVFITDTTYNQLIVSLTHICINGSSFIINYSTNKPLPHNVCLYILLNITSLKEIVICRTINKDFSINNNQTHENHTAGPSFSFIVIQSVFIVLMMLIIWMVQIATNKRLVYRVSQHLFRAKPVARTNRSGTLNDTRDAEITNENYFILSPIEKQILSATDLTSIRNDRRFTNHTLIDVKELSKRLSIPHKDIESHTF